MTNMEFTEANAARRMIPADNAVVWFQVEQMPIVNADEPQLEPTPESQN